MSPEEVARIIELGEAESYHDYYSASPPEAARSIGLSVKRLGSATARLMRGANFTLFNAVTGLGIGEPATEAMLDEIMDFYIPAGVNFMVQVSPYAQPAELTHRLEARGFKHQSNWVKLFRGVEPPPDPRTSLQIREIGADDVHTFAETVLAGFEMPPSFSALKETITPLAGREGWRLYLGFDGKLPVSTAALFVQGETGWLGLGSTLSSHRGRGGQSAMFARRIRDAATMGCRNLVTETGAETPANPNPSYHNMLRAGFRLVYERPNYVYRVNT